MKKTYAKPDKELLVSDPPAPCYDRNGGGAQGRAANGEGKTSLDGGHKPLNGDLVEEP